VLTTLDLHGCAHTRVGDAELKGISGGEKRRLSLGVQLLADPAVCLLDAFTARHVVRTLQQLAHK
jgi:ATP-binding cassette subfamily G (WHITE) protein 8 (sterolin 2)